MATTETLARKHMTRPDGRPLLTIVGNNISSLNGRGSVPARVASEIAMQNSSGSMAEIGEVVPLGLSVKEFKISAAIKDGLPDDTVRFSTYFDNRGSATDILRLFGTPTAHKSIDNRNEIAKGDKDSTTVETVSSIQEVRLENGSLTAYDGRVMRGDVLLTHVPNVSDTLQSQLVSDYAIRDLRDTDSNVIELISPLEYVDGRDEDGILNRITTATVVRIKDKNINLRNIRVNDTSKGAKEILTIARELGTRKKIVVDGKGAESERSGLPRAYTLYSSEYAMNHVEGEDRPFGRKLRSIM